MNFKNEQFENIKKDLYSTFGSLEGCFDCHLNEGIENASVAINKILLKNNLIIQQLTNFLTNHWEIQNNQLKTSKNMRGCYMIQYFIKILHEYFKNCILKEIEEKLLTLYKEKDACIYCGKQNLKDKMDNNNSHQLITIPSKCHSRSNGIEKNLDSIIDSVGISLKDFHTNLNLRNSFIQKSLKEIEDQAGIEKILPQENEIIFYFSMGSLLEYLKKIIPPYPNKSYNPYEPYYYK